MSPEIPFLEKLHLVYGQGKGQPVTPVQIQRFIKEQQHPKQGESKPARPAKMSAGKEKIRKRKIRTRVKKRKHQGNNGKR